jgi:hypothetical protein
VTKVLSPRGQRKTPSDEAEPWRLEEDANARHSQPHHTSAVHAITKSITL